MGEADKKENKEGRRFSQGQYKMLKRCSEKKDMTEWNEWREEQRDEDICLEGANLSGAYLKGAYLQEAHLRNAELLLAHMENVHFMGADLEGAKLRRAHLESARLWWANLKDADLCWAHLEGADLSGANLKGANCSMTIIDGSTLLWLCSVDRRTDFDRVGLTSARIDAGLKQLLEYNIRRRNWEKWYKGKSQKKWVQVIHKLVTFPVRLFWLMSDYGLSTSRVVATFFSLAIIFATVYFVWGALDYYYLGIKDQPGIVEKLFVPVAAEDAVSDVTYLAMVYFRSIYFSIVTMTTLGFGDMYANATRCEWRWWFGHLLLMVQVILGYVLLAALVTRFAVLFTAGGPAGKFAEGK